MRSSFFQSTKVVLLGMGVAQAIPLLGSLILARLYVPSEFGIFSTWLGVVMSLAVFVTARMEMALVVEADGEPRRFAMAASLATTCALAVILMAASWIAYFFVPVLGNFPASLFFAVMPATILMAMIQTWQSWAAAEGLYTALSWIRIFQAAGVTLTQVAIGMLSPSAAGLALGHGLGLLLGLLVAVRMMPPPLCFFRPWRDFRKKLVHFWSTHRRFPIYALPADFINIAAGQLPLFFIGTRFGADASGFYALTVRMLGGPISLMGTAILDVFKRTAAVSYREKGNCRADYLRTFRILAGLGTIMAVGIVLLAEDLFLMAFGETWRQAGVIAIWLMPMFALRFVASPLSYVMYIAGKQRIDLIWQVALLAMTIVTLVMGSDFEASIKAYAGGYTLLYVVYLMLSYRYSLGARS
jgi:O-antigen/teichoic acid export membrane protein